MRYYHKFISKVHFITETLTSEETLDYLLSIEQEEDGETGEATVISHNERVIANVMEINLNASCPPSITLVGKKFVSPIYSGANYTCD